MRPLALFVLLALPLAAQPVRTLAADGLRPITANGRVAWLEGTDADALQLLLWDGRNTAILDEAAAVARPGWPDLDASGRVAYVKVVGGRYELMVWDGLRTVQVTHSDDVDSSDVDLGAPGDAELGGFPQIAVGDVVFADVRGDVYLYESTPPRVRRITRRPDQRVARTTSDFRSVMQMTGVKPLFYYDGRSVVWMHQVPGPDVSTFTVFRADAEGGYAPVPLGSFQAATPHSRGEAVVNAALAGTAFDPFFEACGPEVAWMYRPPGAVPADVPAEYAGLVGAATAETALVYHDGTSAEEIVRGDLAPLSLGVSDGHVVWIEHEEGADDEPDRSVLRGHRAGRTSPLATIEDPPPFGEGGQKVWTTPGGLEVAGDEVVWFMDEVECQAMPVTIPGRGSPCSYVPTGRTGVFTLGGGPRAPRATFGRGEILAGGSFAAGRYAWRAMDGSVKTAVLVDGLGGDAGGLLQLTDLQRPDRTPLGTDDDRAVLVDAFRLRAASGQGECTPGGSGDDATVTAFTFSLAAEGGVLPDLGDVAALRLYRDADRNRQRDAADPLLGEVSSPGGRVTITLDDALVIRAGDDVQFLVELEMKDADELCPCNEYTVALAGDDVEAGAASVSGSSTGAVALPNAVLEPVAGDGQAGLPTSRLETPLRVRAVGLPSRCAEALRFRLVNTVAGDDARLDGDGETGTDLELAPEPTDAGLEAEVALTLGQREGGYQVEASVLYAGEGGCDPPAFTFAAHAGQFVFQVVDANRPDFVDATPGPNHDDYDSWTVSLTDDLGRLAVGGHDRIATTADGLSVLLLRARLIGLSEAPEGEVTFTLDAGGADGGFLTPGLGEAIPTESGAATVSAEWTMTESGPVAVALYTPPPALVPAGATDHQLTLRAHYQMPNASEPSEREATVLLRRPPVLLTHGMWSGPEAWGPAYTGSDPRFEIFTADYAARSAEAFDGLGGMMRDEVRSVREALQARGIAVTQVAVVAHSMGGLVTRQYVGADRGRDYRRPDTFGQGDVYALVTVGTPHFGSPIAWLTIQMRDNDIPDVSDGFMAVVDGLGLDVWSGAVDALCPGSDALVGLKATHVPTHTVRAWHYDSLAPDFGWGTLADFLYQLVTEAEPTPVSLAATTLQFGAGLVGETGLQALFDSQKTDYLVTVGSQGGGINPGHEVLIDETLHSHLEGAAVGETVSAEVAARIFAVLAQSPDDHSLFAPSLPAPIVESDTITCE